MTLLLQLTTFIAALAILVKLEPLINKMGPTCRISIRAAITMLLVAALWLVLSITQGYRPEGHLALLVSGLALWLWSDKRKRVFGKEKS